MLTNNEKQILGYMVDMGSLRGQERINAGVNDELAQDLIANFKAQMQMILPKQISGLEMQKQSIELELNNAQELLTLLIKSHNH